MFNNWVVKYFKGGYLATSMLMTKHDAKYFLNIVRDAHCIEKVKGLFKGQIIYKYKR